MLHLAITSADYNELKHFDLFPRLKILVTQNSNILFPSVVHSQYMKNKKTPVHVPLPRSSALPQNFPCEILYDKPLVYLCINNYTSSFWKLLLEPLNSVEHSFKNCFKKYLYINI